MHPAQIIARKRDGHELSADDIAEFIGGYVDGSVPDYQMSAMAMAIYLRGMTDRETADLTRQMLRSGANLAWNTDAPKVDKHSTGGIGDKVSLALAPLVACCGVQVPMISGRGLGATGGTLDKLESIAGYRTDLDRDAICRVVQQVGCVITGSTEDLVPADRKLYALRDVTATVASIPLITASIMSKKLAEGLDALVLDVKFGSGAFMKTQETARALAGAMVEVGRELGLPTTALVTAMDQPLGQAAGNALEVDEAVACLAGGGPPDLAELVLALGAEMLISSGLENSIHAAAARLESLRQSGLGLEKLREMVRAQGGNLDAPRSIAPPHDVPAGRDGYVQSIDTEALGLAIVAMGGGRQTMADRIDHAVGIEMLTRIGQPITRGQPLVRLRADESAARRVTSSVAQAVVLGDDPPQATPLIAETMRGSIAPVR